MNKQKISLRIGLKSMDLLILILSGGILLIIISQVVPKPLAKPLYQESELPPHEVRYDISAGRPQTHILVTKTDFTMKRCRDLIDTYRHRYKDAQEILVLKPRYGLGSSLKVWCIDYLNGQEIVFLY